MLSFPGYSAILLQMAVLAVAGASSAAAQERCSGTLCDLYYGGPAPEPTTPAKPGAPTPLVVPSGGILGFFSGAPTQPATPGTPAAPAKPPLVGVGGGGLAAMARGEPAERCTGTLCDWMYGGPPPERPAEPAGGAAAAPQAADPQAAEAAPEPAADDEPAALPRHRPVEQEKPLCAAPPNDPWKCYR